MLSPKHRVLKFMTCVVGKNDKWYNMDLFSYLKYILISRFVPFIRFNRVKNSPRILWVGVMTETWSETPLEASPGREREAG